MQITLADITQRRKQTPRPPVRTASGSMAARTESVAQRKVGKCVWVATPDIDAARRAYPSAVLMGYLPSGTLLSHFPQWHHVPSVHLLAIPTGDKRTQVISRLQEHGCLRSRVDSSAIVSQMRGFVASR